VYGEGLLKDVLSFSLAIFLAGCSIATRDIVNYHSFSYPPPASISQSPAPGTLMIYRFLLDPSIERNFLVVNRDKGKNSSMTYHRWSESPADMITDLIQRDLSNSGLFRRVVGQLSSDRYRYALEGKIRELRGETKEGKSAAIVAVQAELTDFGVPLGGEKQLMEERYRVVMPCKNSSPPAIVRGLNAAVKELSKRLRNDIRDSLTSKGRIPPLKEDMGKDVAWSASFGSSTAPIPEII
jgi:ABC-type uncharacterized transport system auxiliary subunit